MTLTVDAAGRSGAGRSGEFDVRTVRTDATRATLEISGRLDLRSAPLLAEVIDGHLRAGRRYLRLNVAAMTDLDREGADVLVACHDRLLGVRGTLILTGVGDTVERTLRERDLDDRLFLIAPTAAELLG